MRDFAVTLKIPACRWLGLPLSCVRPVPARRRSEGSRGSHLAARSRVLKSGRRALASQPGSPGCGQRAVSGRAVHSRRRLSRRHARIVRQPLHQARGAGLRRGDRHLSPGAQAQISGGDLRLQSGRALAASERGELPHQSGQDRRDGRLSRRPSRAVFGGDRPCAAV